MSVLRTLVRHAIPRIIVVGWLFAGLANRVLGQTYQFTTVAGTPGIFGDADGVGATAGFNYAKGLTIDAAGVIYVASSLNHTIRRVSPVGVVTTVAGRAYFTGHVDATGSEARFDFPVDIAVDGSGTLYVAEGYTSRTIRRITPAGVVSTWAGAVGQFGYADGPGFDARFAAPINLVADVGGNVYVSDWSNDLIRKIAPDGTVSTLVGALQGGRSIDGPRETAWISLPGALALDRAGNLYLVEGNCVIRKITPAGFVTTLAGRTSETGTVDGRGIDARFQYVNGLAAAADGTLFVTDWGSHTLRRISPSGDVTTIAGNAGQPGIIDGFGGNARFDHPGAIAVDAGGRLFLLDGSGSCIRLGTPSATSGPPVITLSPAAQDQQNRNIGAGTQVTLSAAATGSAPLSFQWTKNGAMIPGATATSLVLTSATASDEGIYVFRATNAAGSVLSEPVTVRVYTPALTSFTSRREVPGGSFLWAIASGAGQLVAVGTEGTILTSAEGRGWTRRVSGTNEWLVGVTYAAGKFVAVGDHGIVLVSSDGLTWQRAAASSTTQRLNNVAYGAGTFVAVGEGGTILTSADAQTWVSRASGVNTWLRGLYYRAESLGWNDTGSFYAGGQNGVVLASVNGVQWDLAPYLPSGKDLEAMVGGPTGIGADGELSYGLSNLILSTAGSIAMGGPPQATRPTFLGYRWRSVPIGIPARFRGIAVGAGAIFVTGENGVIAAAASTSGPWARLATNTTANLVAGLFVGNSLFVVGENETILQSEPLYPSRLLNLSTRGTIGEQETSEGAMISGFAITGTARKSVLIRAVGPSLINFGVAGLPTPVLRLNTADGRVLAANNLGWNNVLNADQASGIADAARRVGAFPLSSDLDAALLVNLEPGSYTTVITDRVGLRGVSLLEIYDADPTSNEGSRVINLSTRGPAGPGAEKLIAGFVVNGASARRVLIRAIGPSLAQFGVTGVLAAPQLELYDSSGSRYYTVVASQRQYSAEEIRAVTALAGAFPLADNSEDAVLVTTLLPGAWTVQVSDLP